MGCCLASKVGSLVGQRRAPVINRVKRRTTTSRRARPVGRQRPLELRPQAHSRLVDLRRRMPISQLQTGLWTLPLPLGPVRLHPQSTSPSDPDHLLLPSVCLLQTLCRLRSTSILQLQWSLRLLPSHRPPPQVSCTRPPAACQVASGPTRSSGTHRPEAGRVRRAACWGRLPPTD